MEVNMSTNRTSKQTKGFFGALAGAAMLLAAQAASAGTIVGSAHDFTGSAWSGGQICVACHAPHNTAVLAEAPLWNHALNTSATYTAYTSSTMNAVTGQPGAVSKLCLSCHDGALAVNSFGGATGSTYLTGSVNLGTNLSNDHPIGFTYDAALVTSDGALNAVTDSLTIGTGGTKTRAGTISSNMLYAGKVECASCHDVHNTFTVSSGYLLKVSMTASALCTTCHAK
jgi:predicted CXXCH cytochrome family protein